MAKVGRFSVLIPHKKTDTVSEHRFTHPAEDTLFGMPTVTGPVASSGTVRYDVTVLMDVSGSPSTWTELVTFTGTTGDFGTATVDGPVIVVEDPPKTKCSPDKDKKKLPYKIKKAA